MLIRCWGARGSISVSGKEYLRYGGDTTCIEIRTKDDRIVIIDAGSGIRRLGNRLIAEGRLEFAMIFTHAHWDHIMS
ncbi:MAG: MBL fold metallo-hydrolase, partial [Deltaproteobacteria bacterium]|nr:MBL fold metallo-hydrolase [Deltaproteobacteria bacterium]